MKKILWALALVQLVFSASAESRREIDSLQSALREAWVDTGKAGRVYILTRLAEQYMGSSLDTALLFSNQAFRLANKINDLDGLSRASNVIGTVYLKVGNYPKSLEYYIRKLKIEEQRNDPEMTTIALMNIAGVYLKDGNYNKAIAYTIRCDSIIEANGIRYLKLYILLNLGDMYEKSGDLPTALIYTRKALDLAIKEDNISFEGAALNNLGNIYSRIGNRELAIQNYKNALPYLKQSGDYDFISESTIGLARQYLKSGKKDSALFYGLWSYEVSKENGFLNKQLDAGRFLSLLYKEKNDFVRAFAYQEEAVALNDSVFGREKIARSQFLSMEEDLRQKELAEKKAEAEHERIMKLQLLTIGLSLPILFFITLYLSNRKVKPKYIEFLGVVSLLLTFEYIMLFIHPMVGKITHHLPFYQLLIFAAIASVLTPAHHRIEKWLMKILARKEKVSVMKIRIQ